MNNIEHFGIGTDIESIERFRGADYTPENSLLNRIFTKKELEYCFSIKDFAPHLAARYSAKEAIVKALASIGKVNLSYREIEISNNESGVPLVKINKKGFHNVQLRLSLSHCEDKAVAFAVAFVVNHASE
jgi:holo-[acyl-carrier protein] synthase